MSFDWHDGTADPEKDRADGTIEFESIDEANAGPSADVDERDAVEEASDEEVEFESIEEAGDDEFADETEEVFGEGLYAEDESDWEESNEYEAAADAWTDYGTAAVTEARWVSDEVVALAPVEFDLPTASRGRIAGTLASIVLHVWLVMTLAGLTLDRGASIADPPLISRVIEEVEEPEEIEEVIEYDLAPPKDQQLEVRKAVNAKSVGASKAERLVVESPPELLLDVVATEFRRKMYDIPEGLEVNEKVVVKGTTGEAMVQLETALDQVTWEIAQNLQEHKMLVVWLLDASGSLVTQREVIAKRFARIYGELDALKDHEQIPRKDEPLLTGVVTFGEKTTFLTREPTNDFETIRSAIAGVKNDESGEEKVFAAVATVMKRWGSYRRLKGRRIMVVAVTDEAGDDYATHLELAIARCRTLGAKAYVIGPSAVFGRRTGYVPYVAPENGRTYQLGVDIGPETAMPENVSLPFWFNGPQYKYLASGFGPYSLARLVSETGGVYFMSNMTTMEGLSALGVYDSEALKPLTPDYGFATKAQFKRDLRKYPLRLAVVKAALLSRENIPKGTPRLDIRVTPANFRQVATQSQLPVAESQMKIERILAAFPSGIEKAYATDPSLRWRMSFCLSYGRLLAQKTRCLEYNYALAMLKGDRAEQDIATKSNRWIIHPHDEINYATTMRKPAKLARQLLEHVVAEAPGTPFAVLASRELQQPFGLRVEERFIPPPPKVVQRRNPAPTVRRKPKPRLLLAAEKRKKAKAKPKPKPVRLPKL
jgi:hypothetical protein